jgi:RNA polymerase sigma factor (sigma-70 family)
MDLKTSWEALPMSEPTGDITQALRRLSHGDGNAPGELESLLKPFLLQMLRWIRRRISGPLQARIDSQALLNAALNSFPTGVRKQEFPLLKNRDDVKKLLREIVRGTLTDEVRRQKRIKRSPDREVRDETGRPQNIAAPADPGTALLAGDLAAWLEEKFASLHIEDETTIRIVELRLEGLPNADIADQLGLSVSQVRKILRLLRERWDEEA